MQLDEIIEENSILTISKRTRIPVDNIERLVSFDFSSMKRVKAYGFISILEREFNAELKELRKECDQYFSSHPEEKFDASLVVTIPESDGSKKGTFFKLLVLVMLAAGAYYSWNFFIEKRQLEDTNTTSSTGFISSIINQAQDWLGNSDVIVDNSGDNETVPGTDGVWAKEDKQDINSSTPEETATEEPFSQIVISDKDKVDSDEKIIQDAKDEQKNKINDEGIDSNSSDPFSIESIMGTSTLETQQDNTTDERAIEDNNSDEALLSEVPSMIDTASPDDAPAIEAPVVVKPPKVIKKSKSKIVVLHPKKNIWIGYVNLSTMKRDTKVTKEDMKFDTSESRWIVVTGHGGLNFIVNKEDKEISKSGKNYFLIKRGDVTRITQKEFQKLNKSKVW